MAINPSTNATMAGRVTAADANYPYASAKDETAPGAGDGSPYFKARADDLFGFQQALLKAASIVPSGNADTALVSQYIQGIIELASGRAFTYDDAGAADVYVFDVQANQQPPASLFEGLRVEATIANTNTGASTLDAFGSGVVDIHLDDAATDPVAGDLAVGLLARFRYSTVGGAHWELVNPIVSGAAISAFAPDAKQRPTLTIGTDASHDIDFGVGSVLDSLGDQVLTRSSVLIKQIDATWVAGTNMGGLFSGTVANNTSYHAFLIKKDSDGSIDAGFDTSPIAANIPPGYTAFRRIGSFYTNGSANIVGFVQFGNKFFLNTFISDYDASVLIGSLTNLTLSIPDGIRLEAIIFAQISDNTTTATSWFLKSKVAGGEWEFMFDASASNNTVANNNDLTIITDTSANIQQRATSGAARRVLRTRGWIDDLLE